MVHWPKIFWRRGGRGGEVAEINLFRKKNFQKWSGTIRKVGQISFCPPNFFLPVRPWGIRTIMLGIRTIMLRIRTIMLRIRTIMLRIRTIMLRVRTIMLRIRTIMLRIRTIMLRIRTIVANTNYIVANTNYNIANTNYNVANTIFNFGGNMTPYVKLADNSAAYKWLTMKLAYNSKNRNKYTFHAFKPSIISL
jgi:hypothetical protein